MLTILVSQNIKSIPAVANYFL